MSVDPPNYAAHILDDDERRLTPAEERANIKLSAQAGELCARSTRNRLVSNIEDSRRHHPTAG